MKINEMPVNYNRQAFVNNANENTRPDRDRQKTDTTKPPPTAGLTVTLSETSRQLSVAKVAVANAPDLRADKVAQLQESIRNGTYRIDPEKIAEKMIPS